MNASPARADETREHRPRLLILSFSRLQADARLMKQIRAFGDVYDVVTCGFGEPPAAEVRHIPIVERRTKWNDRWRALFFHLRLYRLAARLDPHTRQARRLLRGESFDAVLANDLDTIHSALHVAPGEAIHLDLHEFWPGLHDNEPAWVALRVPFYAWQLRRFASTVRSCSTVNQPLAERYRDEYGIECTVVTNATEYTALHPSETSQQLRLVHSGAARPNRRIEGMIEAVRATTAPVTLDLLLIGVGTPYYRRLQELAAATGGRVRILPPVPHGELVQTLNRYDVGLPFLPPTTTNIRLSLPNKFFDYVQARLAILTGPTPPIAELVADHDLGIVTEDFGESSLIEALEHLTPEDVARWKQHSEQAALALSAGPQVARWRKAIADIVRERQDR